MNESINLEIEIWGVTISFPVDNKYNELVSFVMNFNNTQIADTFEPQEKFAIERSFFGSTIAQLWVVQLQSKAVRQCDEPFSTEPFQAAKPYGKFLNALLELCAACLNFIDENGASASIDYKNAYQWWTQICIELEIGRTGTYVARLRNPEHPPQMAICKPRSNKESFGKDVDTELNELDNWRNPYGMDMPHLYELVNVSIAIGQPNPNDNNKLRNARKIFRNSVWSQYKQTYKQLKLIITKGKHYSIVRVSHANVTIHTQKRGRKVLFKAPSKFSLKQSRRRKT